MHFFSTVLNISNASSWMNSDFAAFHQFKNQLQCETSLLNLGEVYRMLWRSLLWSMREWWSESFLLCLLWAFTNYLWSSRVSSLSWWQHTVSRSSVWGLAGRSSNLHVLVITGFERRVAMVRNHHANPCTGNNRDKATIGLRSPLSFTFEVR